MIRIPHKITKTSPISGNIYTAEIFMDPMDYEDFVSGKSGRLIQDIFPYLTADEREFLLTGITVEEWEAQFGGEGEV